MGTISIFLLPSGKSLTPPFPNNVSMRRMMGMRDRGKIQTSTYVLEFSLCPVYLGAGIKFVREAPQRNFQVTWKCFSHKRNARRAVCRILHFTTRIGKIEHALLVFRLGIYIIRSGSAAQRQNVPGIGWGFWRRSRGKPWAAVKWRRVARRPLPSRRFSAWCGWAEGGRWWKRHPTGSLDPGLQ